MLHRYSLSSNYHHLFRIILTLVLVFFQPTSYAKTAVGGDALSQFVKNYGCGKTKALATASATKVMTVWADNVVGLAYSDMTYGDISRDQVYGIIHRGHVQQALNSIGDLLNFITVVEETAFGDPKIALRKASDWGIDYNVGMIAGPKGAAVWGVMKTLSTFAADLNKEILSLNMDTFGNYVLKDPRLGSPKGGDIFLEEYAQWSSDKPHNAFWDNVRKQRAALIDYANITLNQAKFPRFVDWRKPKYRNQVRVAARLMMKDAATIAEVMRKQQELQTKIPGLKQEVAVLEKFQHWYALLKGVTCTEGMIDDKLGPCLNGLKQAQMKLPETAGLEFDQNSTRIKTISDDLDQWNRQIDRLAGELEIQIVEVEQLCREQRDSWEMLSGQMDQFDRLRSQINLHSQEIVQHKTNICGDDNPQASPLLSSARRAYDRMMRDADEATSIHRTAQSRLPPMAIDFTTYSDQLNAWKEQVTSMKADEVSANSAFRAASKIELEVDLLLRSCPSVSEFNKLADENPVSYRHLADKRAQLQQQWKSLKQRLSGYTKSSASPNLNNLHRRITESQGFINERIDRQTQSRVCLSEIPDIAQLLSEGELQTASLQAPINKAEDALSAIQQCLQSADTAHTDSSDEETAWSEGGYDNESTFDGSINQIHAAAQNCDYHQALALADQVLAQDPDNHWVNQNYTQLQHWSTRGDRFQQAIESAISGLENGDIDASLRALNRAMKNASAHCGQAQTVNSLREQAQRIADLEREEMIEQAKRESRSDARERARQRERYRQREAERRRTAESLHTIMTGVANALQGSSGYRGDTPSTHSSGDDDIVDRLVKQNERKYGDMMDKWQQSNNTSIRPPPSPPRTNRDTDGSDRGQPDPATTSPGWDETETQNDVGRAPLPPPTDSGGVLPPATGGFECSGSKEWCDEVRNSGW
ncbi:MAG: hypothetical protein MI756_12650 [Chromatiales bacterium]|nr:hypothetical protein [Chromatiales bacterium]